MSPSPQAGMSSAMLPPLSDMSTDPGGQGGAGGSGGFMAALMAAVTPVKSAVDGINMACQKIVQSGSVPGSEQICGQIVALANQLTVMAMQQAAQGAGGAGAGSAPQGGGGPMAGAGAGAGAGQGGPAGPIPPATGAPPVG